MPADAESFQFLDLSRESGPSDQIHSGISVRRAELAPLLASGALRLGGKTRNRWKNAGESMSAPRSQKPLELILARNLLTSLSTPAFLLDYDAAVVFYNEAAAALLGRSFEDAGRMEAEQWTRAFGPFEAGRQPGRGRHPGDDRGDPRRPPRARDASTIRTAGGETQPIEASAFPIVASEQGSSGAMILFWPLSENGASRR